MGVPTSEVGYTTAMPRREDYEVHKDMWWHWIKIKKKKHYFAKFPLYGLCQDLTPSHHLTKFIESLFGSFSSHIHPALCTYNSSKTTYIVRLHSDVFRWRIILPSSGKKTHRPKTLLILGCLYVVIHTHLFCGPFHTELVYVTFPRYV
jgi:hypothetical protein